MNKNKILGITLALFLCGSTYLLFFVIPLVNVGCNAGYPSDCGGTPFFEFLKFITPCVFAGTIGLGFIAAIRLIKK